MRDCENIEELVKLSPDYIGFIFYDKSKRFVADFPKSEIPKAIKKVGVFVNESVENIVDLVIKNQFDGVQLHGNESFKLCEELKRHPELVSGSHNDEILKQVQHDKSFIIIKAFSVDEHFNFSKTKEYEQYCDLFIFDTKGKGYGGTGLKYDWSLLQKYKGNTPFLLSGGIGENDAESILLFLQKQESTQCIGVDLNSGFEDAPGIKNIEKLKTFIHQLNV